MELLIKQITDYFNLLITKNYTRKEIKEFENRLMLEITLSDDIEQLTKAKELVDTLHDTSYKSHDERVEAFKHLLTFAAKGVVLGASIGFFANNTRLGAMLGPIVALEINGLKYHYHKHIIESASDKFSKLIENQLNQSRDRQRVFTVLGESESTSIANTP